MCLLAFLIDSLSVQGSIIVHRNLSGKGLAKSPTMHLLLAYDMESGGEPFEDVHLQMKTSQVLEQGGIHWPTDIPVTRCFMCF